MHEIGSASAKCCEAWSDNCLPLPPPTPHTRNVRDLSNALLRASSPPSPLLGGAAPPPPPPGIKEEGMGERDGRRLLSSASFGLVLLFLHHSVEWSSTCCIIRCIQVNFIKFHSRGTTQKRRKESTTTPNKERGKQHRPGEGGWKTAPPKRTLSLTHAYLAGQRIARARSNLTLQLS